MSPRAPLVALLFTVFLDLLGFGMVLPILALYAEQFHVGDLAITALGSVYSLMQLFFAPIWGRVSDRYGRRPVLLVSIFGSCASQLGYALAPGFAGLVIARAFAGVCGANIATAQAYIADSTNADERAAGMGLLGAALGLGFVLGPMFGGWAGAYHDRLPFFIASGLAAINFVLAWSTLSEPRSAGERTRARAITWRALAASVLSPRLRVLLLLWFVLTFGFAILEGTFPLYLNRRFGFGKREVGTVFACIGLVMIVVQGVLVRRLSAWVSERQMVIAGTALLALGMLVSARAHDLPMLVVALIAVAAGNGVSTPALSALVSRSAEGDRQGGVLGVAQSFGALARVGGPLCGGWLLAFGEGSPYLIAAFFMLASCAIAFAALPARPLAPQ